MNFQTSVVIPPLKVLVVNPLLAATQLTMTKMLSGIVFGKNQLIDLILLVYVNEIHRAQELVHELTSCAFPCYNTITVTSDLPSITDADVFCIMTNFKNPNSLDFDYMDSHEQFDTFYLIIKLAANLGKPPPMVEEPEKSSKNNRKKLDKKREKHTPIIVGDGLLVIDVLMTIAKTLPPKMLYCATPLISIAKIVLSDYIKVQCTQLNDVYVWAANDLVFHAEVERPYIKHDKVVKKSKCDWDAVGPDMLASLNLEHIQFNESWMKREFIERMVVHSSNNPYGCISKASEMAKTLRSIWRSRITEDKKDSIISLGVISDGSLGTIKGIPYVLPLIITKDSWSVNTRFEETSHLRQEIKRINVEAKEHHRRLVPYCRKFLRENVVEKSFIPSCLDSESASYSSNMGGSIISGDDDSY